MATAAPPVALVATLRVSAAVALLDDPGAVLSPDEARRAAAFRHERDRRRYVAAHVWLRRLLGERLDVTPAAVPISAGPCARCGGPHGKPQLPAATGLHFSLAHAGDLAFCAVAESPVGVDVESVPTGPLTHTSALHPRERSAVNTVPPSRRGHAFARCWVRKEAYLKGTGEGLSREPDAVWIGLGPLFGDPGPSPAELGGWKLSDLDAPPGYAAAVAFLGS